ncbi:MAG TPA: hypothetical protein VNU46_05425 [Gemmatimonadaceae bacterium]|jgi:hypothetical protein|nr:hypothetical protein [Gemmatimonadaceae bacterium]
MTLPVRTIQSDPPTPRPPQDTPLRTERLIAASLALNNVTEQGGNNHGQMVELMLREVDLPAGEPWCAAYVYHVGFWSQYDPAVGYSSWPLPKTGACDLLGHFALVHGVLQHVPLRGDVFLMYFPSLGRFAHTGIVLSTLETTSGYLCTTIEGNTNDDGAREGWKTCIKSRLFPKNGEHRFVRWEGL